MAAAVLPSGRAEDIRHEPCRLLLTKQERFCCRDKGARRLAMMDLIANLELSGVVVAARITSPRAQERAPGMAYALLWELRSAGVGELVIESRGAAQDKADQRRLVKLMQSLFWSSPSGGDDPPSLAAARSHQRTVIPWVLPRGHRAVPTPLPGSG